MNLEASAKSKATKKVAAQVDLQTMQKNLKAIPKSQWLNELAKLLLQTEVTFDESLINQYATLGKEENYLPLLVMGIMSTPEYQMC